MIIPVPNSVEFPEKSQSMMIPAFMVSPSPELKTKKQGGTPDSFVEKVNRFKKRVTSDSLFRNEFWDVVLFWS